MAKFVFPDVKILLDELRCPCCQELPPQLYESVYWNNFLHRWQCLRNEWGKPIKISKGGGWRCPRYQYQLIMNRKTNACLSPHFFGALDNDLDNEVEVLDFVKIVEKLYPLMRIGFRQYLDKGQSFVHIDECYLIKPKPVASWIEGVRW